MRVVPRRPRLGCLGCLTQCILVMLVAIVAMTIAQRIAYPWAFQFGGRTRLLPYWFGAAQVRAASGDYVLYVWFGPTTPARYVRGPRVSGYGTLCTPRGERLPLRLYGSLTDVTGSDTSGKPMRLEMSRRPWYWSIVNTDRRPYLELRGRWDGPDLVMNDGGGFAAAFLPDGRLYEGPRRDQPKAGAPVPVVFKEVPWWVITPACPGR